MSGNPRRVRVASAMRSLLAEMLERDVKDPRVHAAGFISVNHVELNSDMSVARVFVSFSGASSADDPVARRAIAGLRAAVGFLRGQVGRELRLRHCPALHFVADDSVVFQQRLRDLVREDEARAHVDEPSEDAAIEDASGEDAYGEGIGARGERRDGE